MSLEYINAKEFEEVLFPAWAKGREPDRDYMHASLANSIKYDSYNLATDLINRQPMARTFGRMLREAKDAALWREFENEFKVGPTQPGGIIVASAAILKWSK